MDQQPPLSLKASLHRNLSLLRANQPRHQLSPLLLLPFSLAT